MKNLRQFSRVALPLGILAAASPLQAKVEKASRSVSNVLFIIADDFGWKDVSYMGSKYYETPNLDRLAKQSVIFTDGYAACPVSSPSRASALTGQYTPRHGVTDWIGALTGQAWKDAKQNTKVLPPSYAMNLPQSELTLPEYLREFGFATFMAGKWHLGEEGSWPEDHGFEINKGGWTYGNPRGGYFSPYNNPKLKDGKDGENLSMRLAHETVRFMKDNKKHHPKRPFFAYLSFYAVHGPIQTSLENWKYFRDKAIKMGVKDHGFEFDRILPARVTQDNPVYAGLIKQMDDAIGVVLDEMKKMGLDDNTMVVFTSDNGGVVSGDAFSTSLAPLRGGKGKQWEGGIRVPFLINYPGNKQANTRCDVPVNGVDIYPTILDYLQLPTPSEQVLDGVSLMPLLHGEDIAERSLFWHYPHYGNQGGEPVSIIRRDDWKLIYYYEDKHYELYNLKTDIGETQPLNTAYPEVMSKMKTLLTAWLIDIKAKGTTPNYDYNPLRDQQKKLRWKTVGMERKEKQRLDMLKEDWKPNKDWWGSQLTND